MGLLDNEGTVYVGTKLADHVVDEIKRERCPIRLDIPGRKATEMEKNFYTYIGRMRLVYAGAAMRSQARLSLSELSLVDWRARTGPSEMHETLA